MQTNPFTDIEFANNPPAPVRNPSVSEREKRFWSDFAQVDLTDYNPADILQNVFHIAFETGFRLRDERHEKGTPEFVLAEAVRPFLSTPSAKDGFMRKYMRQTVLAAFFAKVLADNHDDNEFGKRCDKLMAYFVGC